MVPADVDEAPLPRERPRVLAERLAKAKAEAVAAIYPDDFILAADTVVAMGLRTLGKPTDGAEATRFLQALSGRRHRVIGGLCVMAPGARCSLRSIVTQVRFKSLTKAEIADYVASGEWQGKAGGYAIQGLAAAFVPAINGSYANVVGLSLTDALAQLRGLGYAGL